MRLPIALIAAVAPTLSVAQTLLADIPPVASLVAQVTGDLAEARLIGDGIADPHGGTLRPSDARALGEADAVFWIGPDLSPWLQTPLDRLAGSAVVVALSEAPGSIQRPFREDAVFESEADHDGHDHDEHAHDDDEDQDGDAHDHEHNHDHGAFDPHLWLDPANARAWLDAIAATMAEIDPDNAATYAGNAAEAKAGLEALEARIAGRLDGLAPRFVMDHDALGHYEDRFGVAAIGAVSDSDAARPGPRRIEAVRRAAREGGAICLLVEAGQGGRPAVEGIEVVEIDPLGLTMTPGPDLYEAVLMSITEALVACSDDAPR